MALRIELPKELLNEAFKAAISSKERAIKAATNTLIKNAIEQELHAIRTAIATVTEIK